jgi:hemoglobin-like flavoprotein
VRFINRAKVRGERVEVHKRIQEVVLDKVPVSFIESWAKAIGSGARVIIHREESTFDFLEGERAGESGSLGGVD